MAKPLLHVGDWNYQDKYYRVSLDVLKGLREKVKVVSVQKAWDWFQAQSIKRLQRIDPNEDSYFFDYTNPLESVSEWEI